MELSLSDPKHPVVKDKLLGTLNQTVVKALDQFRPTLVGNFSLEE